MGLAKRYRSTNKTQSPLGPEVSRRQLLAGVASAGAISILIAFGPETDSRATEKKSNSNVSFWVAGIDPADGVWRLGGLDATGNEAVNVLACELPPTLVPGQGIALVNVVQRIRRPILAIDMLNVLDGTRANWLAMPFVSEYDESTLWTAHLSVSTDQTQVAILLVGRKRTPIGTVNKVGSDGTSRTITATSRTIYRTVVLVDSATGAILSSRELPPLMNCIGCPQVVHAGSSVIVYSNLASDSGVTKNPALLFEMEVARFTILKERLGGLTNSKQPGPIGRIIGVNASDQVVRLASDDVLIFDNAITGLAMSTLAPFDKWELRSAKPSPTQVLGIDPKSPGKLLVISTNRLAMALLDIDSGVAKLGSLNISPQGGQELRPSINMATGTLYVPDASGFTGGIWVHDLSDLSVKDRWMSTTGFRFTAVDAQSGNVLASTIDGTSLLVMSPTGAVISATSARSQYWTSLQGGVGI